MWQHLYPWSMLNLTLTLILLAWPKSTILGALGHCLLDAVWMYMVFIEKHVPHPINQWMGMRFFTISKGFKELLSRCIASQKLKKYLQSQLLKMECPLKISRFATVATTSMLTDNSTYVFDNINLYCRKNKHLRKPSIQWWKEWYWNKCIHELEVISALECERVCS